MQNGRLLAAVLHEMPDRSILLGGLLGGAFALGGIRRSGLPLGELLGGFAFPVQLGPLVLWHDGLV